MGIEIPLEIHHIDGNHKNNKLENLQILCPNCHSLTTNYRGKNIDIKRSMNVSEDVKETIAKLKIKEETRQKEIELRRYIPEQKVNIIKKQLRYCEICGKEIKSNKNKKFCSVECANQALRKTSYDKNIILEQSKTVHSLRQLANIYGVTDNALKKHLKRFGIYNECKRNFLPITKTILQYDLNGNFIKE